MYALLASLLVALPVPALAQTAVSGWLGAAASRTRGTIAVWDEDRVVVSRDDGASFDEVIDAPTRHGLGIAVAIDDDGTLLLRWGDDWADVPVELVRPNGARRTVADHGAVAIAAGAGTRALITRETLVVSFLRGPMTTHALAPACAECEPGVGQLRLGVGAHGEVTITDVEINTCTSADVVLWQRLGRMAGGDVAPSWSSIPLPDDEGGAVLTPALWGFTYGVTLRGTPYARGSSESSPIADLAPGAAYGELAVAHNGRIALALWGGRLVELRGPETRVLDEAAPDLLLEAVDHRGRALALDPSGSLWRFSRRSGWSVVLDGARAEMR